MRICRGTFVIVGCRTSFWLLRYSFVAWCLMIFDSSINLTHYKINLYSLLNKCFCVILCMKTLSGVLPEKMRDCARCRCSNYVWAKNAKNQCFSLYTISWSLFLLKICWIRVSSGILLDKIQSFFGDVVCHPC